MRYWPYKKKIFSVTMIKWDIVMDWIYNTTPEEDSWFFPWHMIKWQIQEDYKESISLWIKDCNLFYIMKVFVPETHYWFNSEVRKNPKGITEINWIKGIFINRKDDNKMLANEFARL